MLIVKRILITSTILLGVGFALWCGIYAREQKPIRSIASGLSAIAAIGLAVATIKMPVPNPGGENAD